MTTPPLQRLRQAFEAHRRALQELEAALVEYEGTLPPNETSERPEDGPVSQLLSIDEVCRALRMGKSWTYRRIKSGEIPSVKLGRSIKVRREDLEQYLKDRRYRPAAEE